MPRSQPPYPPAFRRQMVEWIQVGDNPEEFAREFDPPSQTIRNWPAQANRDEGGLTTQEREDLRRLRLLQKLVLPLGDLVGMDIVLLGQCRQGLVALDDCPGHFRLERR